MTRWALWGAVFVAMGCGKQATISAAAESKVYHTPSSASVAVEEGDGPVGEALAARPALRLPARVAVFAPEEELAEKVADAMMGLQGVEDSYVIRGYIVDGSARWSSPYFYYSQRAPTEIDLEKLRSIAAMARCDALVVVDHSWRQESHPTGWVVTTPLLLPMLFTPWIALAYHSYLDMHLIDVQTGYLYGQISTEHTEDLGASTIYRVESRKIVDAQFEVMMEKTRGELSDLLWYHLMNPSEPNKQEVEGPKGSSGDATPDIMP